MAEKFEMKDSTIVIFKNTKRDKENQPEYKGKIRIGDEIRDISLWVRTNKNNEKYFSGIHSKEWKPTGNSTGTESFKNEVNRDLPF